MLGGEPNGALLARARLKELTVKPGARLHWPFKAHWTGTLETHRPHLLGRTVKAHGLLLLLKAHWSRTGTRTHIVKTLHRAIKVSRTVAFKPYGGLRTHRTIKPAYRLRVRWTVKTADSIAPSNWTVGHVWAIKTTRALSVGAFERRWVLKVPRANVFIPTRWVWPGWAQMCRAVVARGGMSSIVRGGVSRRVGMLTDR